MHVLGLITACQDVWYSQTTRARAPVSVSVRQCACVRNRIVSAACAHVDLARAPPPSTLVVRHKMDAVHDIRQLLIDHILFLPRVHCHGHKLLVFL